MDLTTKAQLAERLNRLLDDRSTDLAPDLYRLSTERYHDPRIAEAELGTLFRRLPLILTHMSAIPEPGDYVTHDLTGIPLIVIRQRDGSVQTLLNACRHRGARLVHEPRGSRRSALTCPYHAWSYRLDGSLRSIPGEAGFRTLDRDEHGLVDFPTEVRHGLVWTVPIPGADLVVTAYLGPQLDRELAGHHLDQHLTVHDTVVMEPVNWKMVLDGFLETLFGNDSLRAGHAEKQARWQDLFAPLIEPRLPDSDRRTLHARAIAAASITCLQAANEEWVRLGGQVDLFDLYDTAVHAVRRPPSIRSPTGWRRHSTPARRRRRRQSPTAAIRRRPSPPLSVRGREITVRLPGRVDATGASITSTADLVGTLRRAARRSTTCARSPQIRPTGTGQAGSPRSVRGRRIVPLPRVEQTHTRGDRRDLLRWWPVAGRTAQAFRSTFCSRRLPRASSFPSPPVIVMSQSCWVRPWMTAIASTDAVAVCVDRRKSVPLCRPTANCPRSATAADAPTLAALSTIVAYTPPCTTPHGVWCSGPRSTTPVTRCPVISANRRPTAAAKAPALSRSGGGTD